MGRAGLALVLLAGLAACSSGASAQGSESLDGSGKVVFTQPSYSCAKGGEVWKFTAYLNDKAGGLKLQLVIAGVSSSGGETRLGEPGSLDLTSPDITQFDDGPLDVSLFCEDPFGPGTYVVRILRADGSKTLAEGNFVITK